MGKKRIALDVEGTLAGIHIIYINEYNKKHGTSLTPKDITDYDMRGFPASLKEFLRDTERIWREKWEKIPPTEPGLAEKIARLSEHYDFDILTDRGQCTHEIRDWLKTLPVPYKQFFGFGKGYSKSCMIERYNIFIDDSPKLAEPIRSAGKTQLLYDAPWNQKINAIDCRREGLSQLEEGGIIRVYNFDDIIKILI